MGRKSEQTKQTLAMALLELMSEIPFNKITVTKLAARAGVDRQTFYYHFETMDDLVAYLCQEQLVSLRDCVAGCKSAQEVFVAVVMEIDKNRAVLSRLLHDVGRQELRDLFHDQAKEVLLEQARGMVARRGVAVSDGDVVFAVEYCLLASASVVVEWLSGAIECTGAALAVRLSRAFEQHVNGLMAA